MWIRSSLLFLFLIYVVYTIIILHIITHSFHQLIHTFRETYTDNFRVFRGQLAVLFVSIPYKKGYAYSLRTCISPAGSAGAVGSCEGLVVGLLHQVGSTVQVGQRTLKKHRIKNTECFGPKKRTRNEILPLFPMPLDTNTVKGLLKAQFR